MLKNRLKNHQGMAMLEILPLLVIFVLMVNFAIGFFGVIHSGILNSIAARNYAFETFRNRSNLNYFRDSTDSEVFSYAARGVRFHGIQKENAQMGLATDWVATTRPIKFTDVKSGVDEVMGSSDHNKLKAVSDKGQISENDFLNEGVNPVWVRIVYGICLDSKCGDG